jgi:hypothetical protein
MVSLSREAILAALSGLTVLACDKTTASAEPPSPPAPSAAAAVVGAKEVPSAAASGAEKEKSCAPGGCGAGQCGGKKK